MSQFTTVDDCMVLELPRVQHPTGCITAVQNEIELPFELKRIYFMYDVPAGEERGAHAHKNLQQLIVAASGSFDVTLYDGKRERVFTLNKPYEALYLKPGLWRNASNFSSGAICLVLASEIYSAEDYIRDYDEFLSFKSPKTAAE